MSEDAGAPSGHYLLSLVVYETLCGHWTVWDRLCTKGRAPRTKETLPDFLKLCRVTRHPLVFRELAGSQRTPGFGASQLGIRA